MATNEQAERRLLADLARVPVVRLCTDPYFGWAIKTTEIGTTLRVGRTARAAARDAQLWAADMGLSEPVLILPDGTNIAAADFLAQEGGGR